MPTEVLIELKYCERCGGLFLRPSHHPQVYCGKCVHIMLEIARPRPKADTTPRWLRDRLALRGAACV